MAEEIPPATTTNTPTTTEKPKKDQWHNFVPLKDLVKSNALLEEYYKNVGVIPESEWDLFLESMRTDLPTTFRVTKNSYVGPSVLQRLNDLISKLPVMHNDKGEVIPPPRPIPWYPEGLAFHMEIGKRDLKKSAEYSELYRFVVSQNDQGSITRQEAVSMIPPLLLDVQPDSRVLDICAAPGSKTTELLELLHSKDNLLTSENADGLTLSELKKAASSRCLPTGFVVANDVDVDRSFMLVHQTKRMSSPCFMVTCHAAESYPKRAPSGVDFAFDRILADVPCSGDGTLRKNLDAWKKWTPLVGHRQHKIQVKIAKRCVYLLKKGGRLVYSTCSINPIEDEAVVAEILRSSQGTMRLVDVSKELPELKRAAGISSWKVFTAHDTWYTDHSQVPDKQKKNVLKSSFPPTPEEAAEFHLERCCRFLPHMQNTGGFFVAVLEKVSDPSESTPIAAASEQKQIERDLAEAERLKKESESAEQKASSQQQQQQQQQKKKGGRRRDLRGRDEDGPLMTVESLPGSADIIANIKKFYAVDEDFPFSQLITRNKDMTKMLFTSKGIYELVNGGVSSSGLRIVHTGLKLLHLQTPKHIIKCNYRFSMESLRWIAPHLHDRVVTLPMEDFVAMLKADEVPLDNLKAKDLVEPVEPGCFVANVEGLPAMSLCAWRGAYKAHLLIPKEEIACLRNLYAPEALALAPPTGFKKNEGKRAEEAKECGEEPPEKKMKEEEEKEN